jgi:ferredoxin
MDPEIYYFSGTGNSLAVARDIAEKLNGRPVPIPTLMKSDAIEPSSDKIGIVFPVYYGGLPNIISRFSENLSGLEGKYIFGVATFGDSPGWALKDLSKIIKDRGGDLAAGFGVRLPYNYLFPASFSIKKMAVIVKLRILPDEKQKEMFDAWPEKLSEILEAVKSEKRGILETSGAAIFEFVGHTGIYKSLWLKIADYREHVKGSFRESIRFMDTGFHTGKECTSCGICSEICPVSGIKMTGGRPVWQHKCEQCFACIQWCPAKAIRFGDWPDDGKRYHHPDVKLSEMMGSGPSHNQ